MKIKLTHNGYMIINNCPQAAIDLINFYSTKYDDVTVIKNLVMYKAAYGDLYYMLYRLSKNFDIELERAD